ncbi:recombinase family protein [Kineothrix alysoides]|nr:recombinase family protein [Kineothrix alysoides]
MEEPVRIKGTSIITYSVGIYSRLSVDHNDRKSESIENQIEIVRQYIDDLNSRAGRRQEMVIYDVYIDRGTSGTSFERAGFKRLMNDVRNHVVDCIIVKDLSRFGRDYLETGNYIEKIFPFLGVRFIAVADDFDSMSEDVSRRKMVMNIKNLANDMYAKDISIRVTASRRIAAESGGYIGSFAPFGYGVSKINGIRKLVINPQSAEIVRYLFQNYEDGASFKEMVSSLYEKKIHRISDCNKYGHVYCKSGEVLHQWNPSVIRGVLSNPVYCGRLVQCRSKSMLVEGQKGIRQTTEKEWITVESCHEPIVELELFEKVNAGLNKSKKNWDEKSTFQEENIFCNILYCKNCGKKMKAVSYQSRIDGKKSYAYYCKSAYYIDERKCSRNYIREEQIEKFVSEQIKKTLNKQGFTAKKLTTMNCLECVRKTDGYREEQRKITQEKQKLITQAGTMYMKYKEDCINRQEYLSFIENKVEYEKFCEKRLEELKRKIRKSELRAEEENKYLRSLQSAKRCKKLNIHLVEALVEKIIVSPDGNLDIMFCFSNGGGYDAER